jgi:hypothetical protein
VSHTCRDDMGDFDRLLQLPADHPERAEVEACPRCGSRLLEFQMFLRGDDVAGAQPADAEARLSERLGAHGASLLGRGVGARDGWWMRLRRLLASPQVAVPALVAMAVIAVGIWRWQPWVDRSLEVRSTTAEAPTVAIVSEQADSDGGLAIAFKPVPSADAYAVRLLRADFTEIRRLGPVTTASIKIDSADVPAGERVYWQVVALKSGDEIAVSPIRSFPPAPR